MEIKTGQILISLSSQSMYKMESVCVYCGSSTGHDPAFKENAILLGQILVRYHIRLVNGGGGIGLMGVMADSVLAAGGKCTGVIPMGLQEKELAHKGMTELIVVPDMHSRKLTMVNLSDAFIAFPGGFGTMDEVFETLTWAQLHLHQKPVILYNMQGYYDQLLQQADLMVKEGFLNKASRDLMMSTNDIHQVLPSLMQYKPAQMNKWTISPEAANES
jgi:uncharacterized protein (TIGR00730 family)